MSFFSRRLLAAAGIGVLAAGLLTACSQGNTTDDGSDTTTVVKPGPGKFANPGDVHIALVRQLSTGDYFEQWLAGAQAQARALGINLDVSSADGNNDQQALNLQKAVNAQADAIIVDHGFAETIDPAIGEAVEAGIPVVGFDVDPGDNTITAIGQSDATIATQALSVLKQDTGGTGQVIYVYVAGFAPLDKRDAVWKQFKTDNPGIEQVAQIGVVNESTATQVADQAKAALQANPGVTAIFAPYDEFAKGATQAVTELGLQAAVKVYGADISTADIAVITAPDSPWVATSATDPSNVGAATVRAAALLVAGETVPALTDIPPALITQQQLVDGKIENIGQLAAVIPALTTPDVLPIPWLS